MEEGAVEVEDVQTMEERVSQACTPRGSAFQQVYLARGAGQSAAERLGVRPIVLFWAPAKGGVRTLDLMGRAPPSVYSPVCEVV